MALISAWKNGSVQTRLDGDTIRIDVVRGREYSRAYLRIDVDEAIKLRDNLSAVIIEATRAKSEEAA